jgi:hypothetical protein
MTVPTSEAGMGKGGIAALFASAPNQNGTKKSGQGFQAYIWSIMWQSGNQIESDAYVAKI